MRLSMWTYALSMWTMRRAGAVKVSSAGAVRLAPPTPRRVALRSLALATTAAALASRGARAENEPVVDVALLLKPTALATLSLTTAGGLGAELQIHQRCVSRRV